MEFVSAADGVRLHVETYGQESAPGATVVLIHGWVLSSQTWSRVIPELLKHDVRVVTYDHRGHGNSDPVGEGAGTIEQMADDLVAVLEEICPPGPLVLAGHSMGGMAILALADLRPELFGGRVVGVVLINTSAGGRRGVNNGIPLGQTSFGRSFVRRGMAMDSKRRSSPKRVESTKRIGRARRLLMTWLLCGRDAAPDDVRAGIEMVHQTPALSWPAFLDTFLSHNRLDALAHLHSVPVTILAGEKDRLTPLGESVRMSRRLPHAALRVFHLVGHLLPLERPLEVSRAITELLPADVRVLA